MLTSILFTIVLVVWLGTAALSRKRLARIKEKDGNLGVAMAVTALLFLISLVFVLVVVLYQNNGTKNVYELLDAATIFFFVVTGVLVLEVLIAMGYKKK